MQLNKLKSVRQFSISLAMLYEILLHAMTLPGGVRIHTAVTML